MSEDKYFAGKGCTCAARSESECACGVDWTDPEVYELRKAKELALDYVSKSYRPEPKYDAERFDKLCEVLGYEYK